MQLYFTCLRLFTSITLQMFQLSINTITVFLNSFYYNNECANPSYLEWSVWIIQIMHLNTNAIMNIYKTDTNYGQLSCDTTMKINFGKQDSEVYTKAWVRQAYKNVWGFFFISTEVNLWNAAVMP